MVSDESRNRKNLFERISQNRVGTKDGIYSSMDRAADIARRCVSTATEVEQAEGITRKQKLELEIFAKENQLFWDLSPSEFGVYLAQGGENEVYLGENGGVVIKFNNFEYSGDDLCNFFERIKIHNMLFPEVTYQVVGFGKNSRKEFCAILLQPFICAKREATEKEIINYMESLGFETGDYGDSFENENYIVFDAVPNNVLIGVDNRIYPFDTQIKHK